MKRKNSIPSFIAASRMRATLAEEWNSHSYDAGASAPKMVGPRMMPPIISPNTAGCPSRRMICPQMSATASIAAIWSANNTKS